jgi:hypothetical protein
MILIEWSSNILISLRTEKWRERERVRDGEQEGVGEGGRTPHPCKET